MYKRQTVDIIAEPAAANVALYASTRNGKVTINPVEGDVYAGTDLTLTYSRTNIDEEDVDSESWEIVNGSEFATIDSSTGVLHTKAAGIVNVKVSVEYTYGRFIVSHATKTDSIEIQIKNKPVEVTGISITNPEIGELTVGDSYTFKYTISPVSYTHLNVQQMFVRYIGKKCDVDLERFNHDFGLAYWSNRINSWEEFPSVTGTINGSLGCEFEKFQRQLVTDFLKRQAEIVGEYKREDQFITHNFDFEWKGYSHGVQPDVDHFKAAEAVTIAGCDIYHPTQDLLTGKEIAFGGDLIRSLKKDNYLLIETEAQGFPEWTPYEGQLRLQAFSHLASGADSVMYWHWHSIHNACETYWKGLLSHDLEENAVYREACCIGRQFRELSPSLVHLKKENKTAIMVSNEALSALKWFPFPADGGNTVNYNDVVRWIYDALYEMNIECDFVSTDEKELERYDMLFVPALYSAPEECLQRIKDYAVRGGCVLATFKTAFTDEHVKVWSDVQPHLLKECFGITYNQFTVPVNVGLTGDSYQIPEEERKARLFMELLENGDAQVISGYNHYAWKAYAAVTRKEFGKGLCIYMGCMTSPAYLKALLTEIWQEKGWQTWKQEIHFPLIIREGRNCSGNRVTYYLNYSRELQECGSGHKGRELFSGREVDKGERLQVQPWNLLIVEEG